jgi:hypothetical protein
MALQTSGPISLSNIQTEFGGSNPISMSEYYGAAAGIPASGAISMYNFYGTSSAFVTSITNGNDQGGSPGTLSGFAAAGALGNASGYGGAAVGTMASPTTGVIPDSNGITWEFNAIGRIQGFGTMTFLIAFRDTTNPAQTGNTPNYSYAWPAGNIYIATDSTFTTNLLTIAPADLTPISTTTLANSYNGCQLGWTLSRTYGNSTPTPIYDDFTDVFVYTGTTYVKIES